MEHQEKFSKDLRNAFAMELALWPNLAKELPELVKVLQNKIGSSMRVDHGFLDLNINEGREGIYQMSFSGLCQACDEWLEPSWLDSFPGFAKFHAGPTNTIYKLIKLAAHQPIRIFVPAPKIGYVQFTFDSQFVEHLKLAQDLIFQHDFKKIGTSATPKWSPGHDGGETVTAGSEVIVSSDSFWFFTQEIEKFEIILSTPVTLDALNNAVSAAVEQGSATAFINISADIAERIQTELGANQQGNPARQRRESQK